MLDRRFDFPFEWTHLMLLATLKNVPAMAC